jgi:two-component system LytT family response regulator
MVSLKAIIIDDENKNRTLLKMMLQEQCNKVTVVGMAASLTEGVEMTKLLQPDIVFLDIRMGGNNDGFNFFKYFGSSKLTFQVVFVTAYSEFVIKAFNETPAIGYLLKPVDPDELAKVCVKITHLYLENMPPKILIDELYSIHKIVYFYIKDKLVRLKLSNGTERIALKKTLDEYEDLPNFLRINRQYVLNINYIQRMSEIDSDGNLLRGISILLTTGDTLMVAVARKQQFLKLYKQRKDNLN